MVRFIDLFAGIGGIRLGFQKALKGHGIESSCVLSSEIDNNACDTYQLNFNEVPHGDIHNIEDIPDFDFLLAGFPCQPFSYAGKQLGFGDTRGTLFFEVERILKKYRPKGFLLENVRGLTTHDKGRTYQTIKKKLENLGYGVREVLLNSSNFGVPQNRVRLYIVGILNNYPKLSLNSDVGASDSHAYKKMMDSEGLFPAEFTPKFVKDILQDDVDDKYLCAPLFVEQLHNAVGSNLSKIHGYRLIDYRGGNAIHSWDMGIKGKCNQKEKEFMSLLIQNRRKHNFGAEQDGKKLSKEQIQTFYKDDDIDEVMASLEEKGYIKEDNGKYNPVCGNMSFEVFKFLDPESISITLTSSDCNRLGVVQNGIPRHITPRECARLQGFPDDFKVNPQDKYAYKQFGNSVSVPVIQAVIKDYIENNNDKLGWLAKC